MLRNLITLERMLMDKVAMLHSRRLGNVGNATREGRIEMLLRVRVWTSKCSKPRFVLFAKCQLDHKILLPFPTAQMSWLCSHPRWRKPLFIIIIFFQTRLHMSAKLHFTSMKIYRYLALEWQLKMFHVCYFGRHVVCRVSKGL